MKRRIPMKVFALVLMLIVPVATSAQSGGVNVTMPLVEQTLRFLQTRALSPPPDAVLLRAGVLRVCGESLSRPGCQNTGNSIPGPTATGPDAAGAWRRILESALAAEAIQQGSKFDKIAFQRFVMDAMVSAVDDPASFYIAPSLYRTIAAIPSDFIGFGLVVAPEKDTLRVVAVNHGSPAHLAGVSPGSQIVKVNGQGVTGYLRPSALAAIWGASGKTVNLTIERKGKVEDLKITYEKWSFETFTLERHGNVSVLRVRYFAEGLTEAVGRDIAGDCKGLVVDLQNAAGGIDSEMVGLADLLLKEGSIGAKELRGDLGNRTWAAKPDSSGERSDLPVAVIVNGGTGGLAEVFSAAQRKAARAILIGTQTAGLDTQATVRSFKDGSAVQVTSTRLFGPDGSSLSEGVLPHLKTDRISVVDLAVKIIEISEGPGMDFLLDAARKAVSE